MIARIKIGVILAFIEIISHVVLESTPREPLRLVFFGIVMMIPPSIYYLVAGFFSFLSLKFIAKIGSDQLVIDMVGLALFMLAAQVIGLFIYHARLPVAIYNYAILIILASQVLRLFLKREGDGVDRDSDIVFFSRSLTMSRNRHLC